MNPGGLVVILLGVWVGCQVFGGHALERLGLVDANPAPATPAPGAAPAVDTTPASSGPRVMFA